MTICQLLIPRYNRRCLPINNNLSKTKHPNVINSVGQKDCDDRNLQVFNYLQGHTIFSYQFLDITQTVQKMNGSAFICYLFLKCHILIQIQDDVKQDIWLQNMSSGREAHLNINMTNKRSQENQNNISIDQQYILCFSLKANLFLFSCSYPMCVAARVELMRTKLCGNLIKINTVINNLHNENYARNAPPVGKLK